MVSSCELFLDDVELTGQKAYVPDFLSALFQESDRIETHDKESESDIFQYRASRDSVLRRLNLMGCTEALTERRFREWRDETIRDEEDYLKEFGSKTDPSDVKTLDALRALSWSEWRRRVPVVLRTQYDLENIDKFHDEIDKRMKDHDPSWLWFDGFDSLLSLRAIIDACTDTKTIALDIGPLIDGGWIEPDEKVCANKIRVVSTRGQPVGPTIILAEGRSDISVLKVSIKRFYPDLIDFITFLDHSEFKVDGGASYVVKFLKAFAAARVPANIVAIFDNDAAGIAAYNDAMALQLPHNMVCIHLPDIDIGRSYPTIGPQGAHATDINGKACGIELYLGRAALSSNGKLRPVRWTGYNQQAATYQGEVDEKDLVQEAFLQAMGNGTDDINDSYPEMRLAWQSILAAAAQAAESSQSLARAPKGW